MLDWIILPIVLAAAVYLVVTKIRRTASGPGGAGCEGCAKKDSCGMVGEPDECASPDERAHVEDNSKP